MTDELNVATATIVFDWNGRRVRIETSNAATTLYIDDDRRGKYRGVIQAVTHLAGLLIALDEKAKE